jgi:Arc/MetJ-type ribon-helix-helix transcriptional regulator/mono/diheme cytochrome c family protein
MKHVRHEILVATLALAVILGGGHGLAAAELGFQPDNDGYKQVVVPFFRKHCAECHVGEKPEGEFSIAKKDLGTDFANVVFRGHWREIVNVLNSHEMPPEDKPQPDATEAAAVVDWITKQAVAAEVAKREQSVVLRRLNRAEYKNTVRDLVGIDFDTSVFPQDPPAGGFDNNGGALTMSPMQIEQYLSAADQILDQALVEGKQPETIRWKFDPVPKSNDSNRVRLDPKNHPIVNGGNNAYEGDWVVVHHESWDKTINARDFRVPQPGTYIVRARVAGKRPSRDDVVKSAAAILKKRQDEQNAKQPERAAQNQAQYDSELKHFSADPMYDYGPARLKLVVQLGSQPRTVAAFDVEGTPDKPQIVEFPVRFTTESAGVTLSYAYDIPKVLENFWLQGKDEFARPEAMIDWLELEGPIYDAWPPSSHTKILFDSPLKSENLNDYVRAVLERFMSEAYRRPVTKEEVDEKFELYAANATGKKSFVEKVKVPLTAVLTSPSFLYLAEAHPGNFTEPLTDHELATRLSYFIWSSQPDAELRQLADSGKLTNPKTRQEQVDRMLADPKADALVKNFAGQWLGLREVGANPPAPDLYPQYDRHLEVSIVGESEAYFKEFLQHDLDARQMIKSDFVTINERLGRFYGIPNVRGDSYQKVSVPKGVARGGIVTQASILTTTSNGTRTSPVKRGTWILKTLLGTDPGLPVANAGEIAPKVPGIDKATVRQRLEIHRQLTQCARCHNKIDPLGFALENFNAAGDWREQEGFGYKGRVQQNDPKIDASSKMPDGTKIVGVAGLQAAMLKQEDLFLKSLSTHLTTYALGRELGLADQPLIDGTVAAMKENGTTVRSLVKAIVASDAFAAK